MPKIPSHAIARRLLLCTAAALVAIAVGALSFIAPFVQFPGSSVQYTALSAAAAPEGQSEAKVNLNQADAEALMTLPGVEPSIAKVTLAWREVHGAFSCVGDLERVDGISTQMTQRWQGLAYAGNSDCETT